MPRVGYTNMFRLTDPQYALLLKRFTLQIEPETPGEAISIRDFEVDICINPLGM